MTAARTLAAIAGLTAGYSLAVRPRILRWGATDEELQRPYPGADLMPGGRRGGTMATTIDAPPARVWPWLVQMGCDRAGWYSWDRLDNEGVPSANCIHPEWQDIAVARRLLSSPSGKTWFQVAAAEPPRFLALRASYDLRGRPFDPAGERPCDFILWEPSHWMMQTRQFANLKRRAEHGDGRPAATPGTASPPARQPA